MQASRTTLSESQTLRRDCQGQGLGSKQEDRKISLPFSLVFSDIPIDNSQLNQTEIKPKRKRVLSHEKW